MKQRNLMILVGLGALAALAVGGGSAMAAKPEDDDGEGGDTKGEGEAPIDLPPPAPPQVPSPNPNAPGDPPNSGATGMLDAYFGNAAGIARALYLLDKGMPGASTMASKLDAEAKDADKDDDLPFVLRFQNAYNKLAAAGRAGKSLPVFGPIPDDLGQLNRDGTMGYKTLAAIYNTLRYFSPSQSIWQLNTSRVKGNTPIPAAERSDFTALANSL